MSYLYGCNGCAKVTDNKGERMQSLVKPCSIQISTQNPGQIEPAATYM